MHCSDSLALYHRPISGGTWRRVARAGTAFEEGIAVHGRVVWVLMGKTLLRSGDSGRTFTAHSVPCPRGHATLPVPESITDDGAHAYVLCVGQGFTGHTIKFVYRTARTPSGWKLAGRPPTAGDSGELAAGSDKAVVLATASAASWLDRSRDAGQRWSTVLNDADGGEGWSDLGFTTATDGVVIHGPAITDGGDSGHPGQLLLTDDGGVTWRLVTF
jgi:hypothetical protein